MKVKMTAATYWDGKRLKSGDTVDVRDDTGARWVKAGIAKEQAGKPPAKKPNKNKE